MCQILLLLCIIWIVPGCQVAETPAGSDKALAALVKELKDPDAGMRCKALHELEEMGPAAERAAPELIDCLKDRNHEVRRLASHALAGIGAGAVPTLCQTLSNTDSDVRIGAAYALGIMKSNAKEAVPSLVKALEEENVDGVRVNIISSLRDINDKRAIPILIRALKKEQSIDVRSHAAWALGGFEENSKEIIPSLIDALNIEGQGNDSEPVLASVVRFNADQPVVYRAVGSLSDFGFSAVLPLVNAIRDPNFRGREYAIQALREFFHEIRMKKGGIPVRHQGEIKDTISVLVECTKNARKRIRLASILALDEMRDQAKGALPAITRSLEDEGQDVRIAAAGAIYRISGNAWPGLAVLSEAINDSKSDVREYAVHELSLFQKDASPLVPQLIRLLKDQKRREDGIYLLKAIGPGANAAVPVLLQLKEQGVESASDALESIQKP
jgi:HEAT repeat protein